MPLQNNIKFYFWRYILLIKDTHHFSESVNKEIVLSVSAWSRTPAVTSGKMSFHNPGLVEPSD